MEIQLKACEKYLERRKRRAKVEEKKATIRPASPRRFPRAASPSRLTNDKPPATCVPTPPKKPAKNILPLPKLDMVPPKKLAKK
jgi:hypothetical protein